MKKVLILTNNDVGLYNFRKELVQALLEKKYLVYISLPFGEKIKYFKKMGCFFVETLIDRRGTNPITDTKLMLAYKELLKSLKPDIVLTYTIKPSIYGGMICQQMKVPYIINITGLGTEIKKKGFRQKVILVLYKKIFKKANCVFFQNESNQYFFESKKIKNKNQKQLPGSGVNLKEHCFELYPESDHTIHFLFIGRMMQDKGVNELLEAAKRIKKIYPNAFFDLMGFCEVDFKEKDKLEDFHQQRIINYLGQQNNVHEYIKNHHAIILPSYHEGMANVLLEAAACGRPVLASKIFGCQETFDEGISGLGFEPKDVDDLVHKIEKFITLPYREKKAMGIAARKKMEQEFDRKIVIDAYIEEIKRIER